jgi:hypothetical protein
MERATEKKRRVVWGVYSQDCYGMDDAQADRYLLRTYDDFGKALSFALETSPRAAIHFTAVPITHCCYDEQPS